MKLSILLNTWDRYEMTRDYATQSIRYCGVQKEVIVTDQGSKDQRVIDWVESKADKYTLNSSNQGNPQSFNRMIDESQGDYIALIANDIKLPPNWATHAIELIESVKDSGIVGFHCVGVRPSTRIKRDGKIIRPCSRVFGTWVISTEVINRVGYLQEFSKYGLWDSDYNIRCAHAGLINYYHDNLTSNHMCSDVGHQTDYRLSKDKELSLAKVNFEKMNYGKDNYFVSRSDCSRWGTNVSNDGDTR